MKIIVSIFLNVFLLVACTSVRKVAVTEDPYVQEKFLIITADDFGASKNINDGISIAADRNAITSISVMSNFTESLPDLGKIGEDHPDIDIGVHLNISTGKPILEVEQVPSLVNATGNFYTMEELLPVISDISFDELRIELRAQIHALQKQDIRLDFLSDQNGVLSFYNPFLDIVAELAKEFDVPVRTPVIASAKYPAVFGNSILHERGRQLVLNLARADPFKAIRLLKCSRIHEMEKKAQKLDEMGILHPDLLLECFWGDPTLSNYLNILEHLPSGTSEIILHLGTDARQEQYPSGLDLDYFNCREVELKTISSDSLKEYYSCLNIRTIGYSERFKASDN